MRVRGVRGGQLMGERPHEVGVRVVAEEDQQPVVRASPGASTDSIVRRTCAVVSPAVGTITATSGSLPGGDDPVARGASAASC